MCHRNRRLDPRVVNSSVVVVAEGQRVSRSKQSSLGIYIALNGSWLQDSFCRWKRTTIDEGYEFCEGQFVEGESCICSVTSSETLSWQMINTKYFS